MKESYIQILGISLIAASFVFIAFIYGSEPRSIEEISLKAKQTVNSAVSKGSVAVGTYEVDPALFAMGLQSFRQDNFIAARDAFERADPEKRDARTQFYIAYSYYRQGWGRFTNDDALFARSLETLQRVALLDPGYRSNDETLGLRTAAELRAELEEGLKVTAGDLNPLRVLNERK
jgi:hypothetical protein